MLFETHKTLRPSIDSPHNFMHFLLLQKVRKEIVKLMPMCLLEE